MIRSSVLTDNWTLYGLVLGIGGIGAFVDIVTQFPINVGFIAAVLVVSCLAVIDLRTEIDIL